MVFVPVTFVLAALLSAQGAVSAPVDPTSSPLAARAPAPSSSSSGVKKPMTLPLPPKALVRTKSAKFKAATPSKHAAKKTDSDAAHVEGKHHRDERHSSSKKKSHKGKSHRERKSHKRRILDWGSDDDADAALVDQPSSAERRDHDHDHDHDRHHDHDHSHSDGSGHDHDHDHSRRLITVYSRDHDHSHDSERHHDHDRSHRHGSERDHDHDHSKRIIDIGSSQLGDNSEYDLPDSTYGYDGTDPLVDVDLNLKKRDDGTTYYYAEDLLDIDVEVKRRGEHTHAHDHDEHRSDRDDGGNIHEHNHRRKLLEFAPLFEAKDSGPFKYVGAKQNAVPAQKGGKKNSKRDGGDVPPSDGCPELSSAVPGYLQLVTPSTESTKPSPLANLVLAAEPAPASPFMMDGSANLTRATVQLVRVGPAPTDESTGLMTVKFVVKMFDAQNANMCCLCASYSQQEVSPLMLSPCASDNSTDFSQSFSYDPVTSFVAPMGGGGGGDSAPDAVKRDVPAPGRFFAQDSFAENVALPPPASSTKDATSFRTSTSPSVTMEDEETLSSSESMSSTSSAPDAATTEEPGTAEDEEPPLMSDITTVTSTTSVTSSVPVAETGARDELIEPTKTVEVTSSTSTTAAAPTETGPAMASNDKDIYLSFRPVVDNIKPADASPSESTTATESTSTTSATATMTESAVPAMATAKHALDESTTATESTTTTSATATATESAVPAAMATAKHEIDGIPAAVTAKPADAEEDDDLPDCDDEDDEDAEVESKMDSTPAKATQTVSKILHSATGTATPAAMPSSTGTSTPAAAEDWPAPYRLRFVRDEDTLATEDGEPEQWPEFEGDDASIEAI